MAKLLRRSVAWSLLMAWLPAVCSCLVWDRLEVTIHRDSGAGRFELVAGPLGSDETEPEGRREDLELLLHEMAEGSVVNSPLLCDMKASLVVREDALLACAAGRLASPEALEGFFEIRRAGGALVYVVPSDEVLVSTNGETGTDAEGRRVIRWSPDAPMLEYTTRSGGGPLSPRYESWMSLAAEYRDLQARPSE